MNHYFAVKGVKIFNLENETLLRHINCGRASEVNIQGNILAVCEVTSFEDLDNQNIEEETKQVKFWNLNQLLNKSIKIHDVANRVIVPEAEYIEEPMFSAFLGTNLYVCENNELKQYSFWP